MNKKGVVGMVPLQSAGDRPLHTRYVPSSRIRLVFFGVSPWLDVILIAFFVVLLQTRIVLQPGTVIELPKASGAGVQGGMVAVMLMSQGGATSICKVFFDDVLYVLNDPQDREQLMQAMAERRQVSESAARLTVYADRAVDYLYLAQMMDMAESVGVREFNLGAQPAEVLP